MYMKKICILILTAFLAGCGEIAQPDLSGIGGLAGQSSPIPPQWHKKGNAILFYAEKTGADKWYVYDNTRLMNAAAFCLCAGEKACPCGGQAGDSCTCGISASVRGFTAAAQDEAGIVIAGYSTICSCAPANTCGCASADDGNCLCEKKDITQVNRIIFTVNRHEQLFYIRFFNAAQPAAVFEQHGPLPPAPDAAYRLASAAGEGGWRFLVNETPVYQGAADGFSLGKTAGLYYYAALEKSAPRRATPLKLEFQTETPYRFP
jgi:hypothetical protein